MHVISLVLRLKRKKKETYVRTFLFPSQNPKPNLVTLELNPSWSSRSHIFAFWEARIERIPWLNPLVRIVGQWTYALRIFSDMPNHGCTLDLYTYGTLIHALCRFGMIGESKERYSNKWKQKVVCLIRHITNF